MAKPKLGDDALRSEIIEAAERILSAGGAGALSDKAVAREAGTSVRIVSDLVGDSEELRKELYLRAFADFGTAQRAIAMSDDPMLDLDELGMAYWDWAMTHPNRYRIMFSDDSDVFRPQLALLHRARESMQPLLTALTRAIEGGILAGDPVVISFNAWAEIHGLVTLTLGNHNPLPPEAQRAQAKAFLRRQMESWKA